ncbi:head vertex assembly chaperone [Pseudomonas phage PspYZU05]|uniref:Capsid and scaffold protein n=1 Tax=Pseudomonas phage PspYZU05 TaxID=1983556 RepID=A0A2U7NLT2_9CAUD|nr:head vertex assembly chaperone [Pseudomonas phage PspYZU05]ASD52018.1 capsid and scaffold protein [Pseudomonas phage PspYZU05]
MNDLIELPELPTMDGYEYEEIESEQDKDKSLEVIKEAMSNVIQEILITLEDGTTHMVYVMALDATDKGIKVEFNTPSKDRKDELAVHVEKCIIAQINSVTKQRRKSWLKSFFRI